MTVALLQQNGGARRKRQQWGSQAPVAPVPGPQPTGPPHAGMSERTKVVGFLVMALGMFMALLDIQIVSGSIAEIQAGLSASQDEISWVQTSYLIAEIVMIPISGWLAKVFSTRWLFTASAAAFTISSVACAMAWSLGSMVAFRAVQGFVGGAMIPLAFSTGFTLFPGPKAGMIPAVLGVVGTLAPTLGPTIGGWITQTLSWHALFYLNIVPGLLVVTLVPLLMRVDEPDFALLKGVDAISIPFIALALGCLEYVLEEGVRYDWFEDRTITSLAVVSTVSWVVVIWRSLRHANPIIDLTAFRDRNYALGCTFSFIVGIGNYGSVYIIPIFLARVRGFNSLDIGEAIFITGVFQTISTVVIAVASKRVDPRVTLAIGLLLYGGGILLTTPLTNQWGGGELFWAQALRGFSGMFIIVSITTLALGNLPPQRLKMASGLYNLMRSLGGAVGIAGIAILLQTRETLHYAHLAEHVTVANVNVAAMLEAQSSRLADLFGDPDRAARAAMVQLTQLAKREALVMAISDILLVMSLLFFAAMLLLPFLRSPKPVQSSTAAK